MRLASQWGAVCIAQPGPRRPQGETPNPILTQGLYALFTECFSSYICISNGARLRENDGPAARVQVGRQARQQLAPPAVDMVQVVGVRHAQAHLTPARNLRRTALGEGPQPSIT